MPVRDGVAREMACECREKSKDWMMPQGERDSGSENCVRGKDHIIYHIA